MNRTLKSAACVLLGFVLRGGAVMAQESDPPIAEGRLGLGLNYPGLGFRYFFTDQLSFELKGQADKDVKIGGLRGYYYLPHGSMGALFLGAELDYIDFKGRFSKGSGAAGEAFAGLEYFITRHLTLQGDAGPAYIFLQDRNDPVSVQGVEYVVNFGLNFYWGGQASERSWSSTMGPPYEGGGWFH